MRENIEVLKEDVEMFRKKVNSIKNDILKPAEQELSDSRQKYAEALSFCKVGDKIQFKDNDPIIVSSVRFAYSGFGLRAYKIKKNGEPYQYDHDVWDMSDWDGWKVIN